MKEKAVADTSAIRATCDPMVINLIDRPVQIVEEEFKHLLQVGRMLGCNTPKMSNKTRIVIVFWQYAYCQYSHLRILFIRVFVFLTRAIA